METAYILITPYSLLKSRTGGIIARILYTTDVNLCAVKMYAPSDAMVDAYLDAFASDKLAAHNKKLFIDYIGNHLRPDNPQGIANRCLLLVLEGDNAADVIKRSVGHITHKPKGDTIRGTYGDYITHGRSVVYFEPAVICASDSASAKRHLRVFTNFADTDGGVISTSIASFLEGKDCETTLVMLKPDALRHRSARPGNIIDMLSKTGLYIIGAKLVRFSIKQAEDFYQPLKAILVDRLENEVRDQISDLIVPGLPYEVSPEDIDYIAHRLRWNHANFQFNRIIEYITGLDPDHVPKKRHASPGKEKCLTLLYHGVNAISKIRDRLGATDPQLAEFGTVRSEFGQDILRNGIHASDSRDNAIRERKIVGLLGGEASELESIIAD
jgi:nucleoside diphosphate kinase